MDREGLNPPEKEAQEASVEDVFTFLEKMVAENKEKGFQFWHLEEAIADLKNDDPDRALDILRPSSYTLTEWEAHKEWFQERSRLLKFLEKKYGREGQEHRQF